MNKTLSLAFVALMTVSILAGCNTTRGAGEDIEAGGQAIQDAAN